MSYRVVVPTAGIGSRLEGLTKHINKSLVGIANRPTISHIIEQFPETCEFVIALGYKGNLVRDFLELTYPNRTFFFVDVDLYKGKGSGLGLTLMSCEHYLQQPFIFLSCDTLVKEDIPEPSFNWMGFARRNDLSEYRTLKVVNGIVSEICEKGVVKNNLQAYIGIAGIYDYQHFWQAMHQGNKKAIHQGESYGIKAILEKSEIVANEFTWFDTGNIESLLIAREEFSHPSDPNILEKEKEAIWFVGENVIKFSDDVDFIANRVNRAEELKGFVPDIHSHRSHMYCYKKINGDVLSEVITPSIFEDFLSNCEKFWIRKSLTKVDLEKFQSNCMKFYKNKTLERVQFFYNNFNKLDNVKFINGEKMPLLSQLLNKIDWNWLSNGQAGRFHGDFHFENILYIKKNQTFIYLDWRQDFAGDLSVGDIYYDLAKLLHGLIVNHGIILENKFDVSWKGEKIEFSLQRKNNLMECEQRLNNWIEVNGFDLKKVRVLTALIYLNIAALHHYPYSLLLYGLGKKMLNKEVQ